ncbi:hypothetical protein MTTB_13240 [Methanothermobacter tenebrarum]|jgi:hypothetical protein|uniref:30S ribosomal protein S21 n=1 Tax=Methanothermobacter tenebrarum TaxID=680118 RepID=A0ABM7YF51_9EURY|nr:hypothetical protein [Methanothermobacter tenebrarum]MDI6882029.1 hypothetical protein [Methanothermobacter sp.]MDX9694002.1 hypothetical protein [Methanothermobacter sp.]BDH79945.1 hypothetical protein MTTB_13240 [Methanothermobacter tenebrarum]HOQ20288.1 hypothetical protein [Methanothermobacter sp.]
MKKTLKKIDPAKEFFKEKERFKKNREKARIKLARAHEKLKSKRLHKLSKFYIK